jgi:hypothetical protein
VSNDATDISVRVGEEAPWAGVSLDVQVEQPFQDQVKRLLSIVWMETDPTMMSP